MNFKLPDLNAEEWAFLGITIIMFVVMIGVILS